VVGKPIAHIQAQIRTDHTSTIHSELMEEDEYGWPLSLRPRSTGPGCRELWTVNFIAW